MYKKSLIAATAAASIAGLLPTSALANSSVDRVSSGLQGNPATADYWAAEALVVFTELGKDNDIRVQVNNAGEIWFRDYSQPLDAGNGCSQVSAHIAKCPPAGATQIRVHAFDGENTITIDPDVTMDTRAEGSGPKRQVLKGGGGRDWLGGGDASDELRGNAGNDVLDAGGGNDLLVMGGQPGLGSDIAFGGAGTDVADYEGTFTGVTVDLDNAADDGAPGEHDNVRDDVENIYGTQFADTLTGSGAANAISARGGSDTVNAGAGDDVVYASDGADTVNGGLNEDRIYGGPGADKLDGGKGPDKLYGAGENDTLYGGGGGYDDLLDGQGGADKMDGGPGDGDTVDYSARATKVTADLTGSAGDDGEAGEGDTIAGTVERLFGGKAGDVLTGNQNANVITGGLGDDDITGGLGADELSGDDGNDTLRSKDDAVDKDTCGNGIDTALADALDGIAADCETADRGQGNAGTGTGTGQTGTGTGTGQPTTGQTASTEPAMTIAKTGSVRKRTVKVKLACPATATATSCKGTLTLRAKLGSKSKRTIAKVAFTVGRGKTKAVVLKVGRKDAKRLARLHVKKVDAKVVSARTVRAQTKLRVSR